MLVKRVRPNLHPRRPFPGGGRGFRGDIQLWRARAVGAPVRRVQLQAVHDDGDQPHHAPLLHTLLHRVRPEGHLRRLGVGHLLQLLRQLRAASHRHRAVFRHEEQLQELRPGDDGLGRGRAPDRRAHAAAVARVRVPGDVHHHRGPVLGLGSPHPPLPRVSIAQEDSGAAAAESGADLM